MTKPRDEFYVGYLPLPAGHARLLRVALPLLVLAGALCAGAMVSRQHDPGSGFWQSGEPSVFSGVLVETPYPMLTETGEGGTSLLVEMTKSGTGDRVRGLGGKRVEVSGWRLQRDGRRMIELEPEDGALRVLGDGQPPGADPDRVLRADVTLRGEIMDSKCFLGAMKPGEGITHRACATLCIRGGIPPMLVTRDADGRASYYLLTDAAGGAILEPILEFVGVPIEIRGTVTARGDVLILRVAPGSVRRL